MDATHVYVTGQGGIGGLTVVAYDRATGARLWRTDQKPVDPMTPRVSGCRWRTERADRAGNPGRELEQPRQN